MMRPSDVRNSQPRPRSMPGYIFKVRADRSIWEVSGLKLVCSDGASFKSSEESPGKSRSAPLR
jgi:hypothetical protein